MGCMFFWILFSLILYGFSLPYDFIAYYLGGKNIFSNPELLYTEYIDPPFIYFPSIATILSLLALFPFDIAKWIFFFILFAFAESSLIMFDKILDCKNVQNNSLRFMILFSMSNGFVIMESFYLLQMKYIAIFLVLLFLKREMVNRKMDISEFNFKFYLVQIILLLFAVMIIPYLIFLIPLYIFHNVSSNEILNREQLKKYLLFGIVFLSSNFMFFVEPSLLIRFLAKASLVCRARLGPFGILNYPNPLTPSIVIENRLHFSRDLITNLLILIKLMFGTSNPTLIFMLDFIFSLGGILTLILLSLITIVINRRKLEIEKKFGYFALFSLFICVYYYYPFYVASLPLIMIFFITEKKELNKSIYLGIFCIFLLFSLPPAFVLFALIPNLAFLPTPLIILRQNIIYIILLISLNINIKINKKIEFLTNSGNFII